MATKKVKRRTFGEQCRHVFRSWSFYLVAASLALGSAPEMIPHLDALLGHVVSNEARDVIKELLLLLGIASRFVPQSVRHTVEDHIND